MPESVVEASSTDVFKRSLDLIDLDKFSRS